MSGVRAVFRFREMHEQELTNSVGIPSLLKTPGCRKCASVSGTCARVRYCGGKHARRNRGSRCPSWPATSAWRGAPRPTTGGSATGCSTRAGGRPHTQSSVPVAYVRWRWPRKTMPLYRCVCFGSDASGGPNAAQTRVFVK